PEFPPLSGCDRLCMWHIMQKLTTKVGTTLCNRTDLKRQICDIVYVFEREWECMIYEFELGENKWLGDMFDMRKRWIPAYLRDVPMAGLMRTTSISENVNHFFGKWTSPRLTLVEFLCHYDTAIKYQRYIERKNDHDSRYRTPSFKPDLMMEKEACKLYTRSLIFDVQDEMFASYKCCIAMCVVQTENMERYSVRDSEFHKGNMGSDDFYVYHVEFCKSEMKVQCSCNLYESNGLLCCHTFYVLRMNNVKEFPQNYLQKQWLKNVKPLNSTLPRIIDASNAV
ncbi:FAR1 DNA binding domain, zinc finger, SWIM-type, MULE transposase domain containing protein, partial [Tanacetum coccineum]